MPEINKTELEQKDAIIWKTGCIFFYDCDSKLGLKKIPNNDQKNTDKTDKMRCFT